LLEVIDHYRQEYIPLIVPMTLINHYVRKYDQPYLKQQVYLNPHPLELQLRNHVWEWIEWLEGRTWDVAKLVKLVDISAPSW